MFFMSNLIFIAVLSTIFGGFVGYLVATKRHIKIQSDLKINISKLEQGIALSKNELDIYKNAQEEIKNSLKLELNDLANRLFESHDRKFTEQNEKRLESFLKPFREQVAQFENQAKKLYDIEGKERFALYKEIEVLKNLNERISQDAQNLTKALKGDSKTQGTWGEVILERILEDSGLKKDVEYSVQTSFTGEDLIRSRPDAVVYLPDEKSVIIDAKVSLTAYERYRSSESEAEQKEALKAHLLSITGHINGLSKKNYENIKDIKTLDFVLMFVPVEGAYLLALGEDPMLFKQAYEKGILITGPSTLMLTLRIIENIWRRDDQSKNAEQIAKKAADLYDKFVSFTEDLEKVGKDIARANDTYNGAWNKLSSGRGNLISRVGEFKSLGVKSKKELKYYEE